MNQASSSATAAAPVVFPLPRNMALTAAPFVVDEETVLLLPEQPSEHDVFLARFLSAHLVDRHQVAPRTVRAATPPPGKRVIAMGTAANPVVRALCAARGIEAGPANPGPEGYVLDVSPDAAVVAGCDDRGALYGLQTLRQLLVADGSGLRLRGARVTDWPRLPFRGFRLYLPGRENLPFFKRFIRDFAVFFKYNTLVLEVNAAMRLDRHPELNAGWYELAKCMNYTRRDRPEGPGRQFQDSVHHDTGDFGIVEKEEVADLCRYARAHGMDVIPEIPSLTHSYYLLTRHRELAEIQKAEWPDTYCPLAAESYRLYFDVLDEYLEVMEPGIVHIGHDEWRMPMHVCPRCKGKDYRELFARDVRKIHDYLSAKGVRTALWGDHLLEKVRQKERRDTTTKSGYRFFQPGGLAPEQVANDIPKDILVFNWFWNSGSEIGGEDNDARLSDWGFEQVYGNFTPSIRDMNYAARTRRKGVLGAAVSSWVQSTEANFTKDLLREFIACSGLLWSEEWLTLAEMKPALQAMMPMVRRNLAAAALPTEDGEEVAPVDIAAALGPAAAETGLPALLAGRVSSGASAFVLAGGVLAVGTQGEGGTALPLESPALAVNEDASSLIFLHACGRPAANHAGHRAIYNFPDTADLLGWYEVVYEDGFVATVPVYYGVNIMEWTWARDAAAQRLCAHGDLVLCGQEGAAPVSFFAYEWLNPRFGKKIATVRLKGSRNFVDANRNPIPSNSVMLSALSLTRKRPAPDSEYAHEDF